MQKKYPLAVEYLDKATILYKELDNQQMMGLALMSKAIIYEKTNEPEKAIPLLKNAIQIADSIGDIQNLSSYYSELSTIYIALKKYSEATPMAEKAMSYAIQVGNRIQEAVIHALFASLYAAQNNLPSAISSGLASYKIVKEEKDIGREQEAAQLLSELYAKTGDTKQAYQYLKISSELNDSLLKQQFDNETAALQTAFRVSEKEKEIQLLNKDKEIQKQKLSRQRILLFASIGLIGLAIGGIFLLINRSRLRQQMKELELRNQIAADLHDEVGSSSQ